MQLPLPAIVQRRRWVVVTGAGIGRAIALDAAWRGDNVAICDIDAAGLKETHALLGGSGVDVLDSVLFQPGLTPPDQCHPATSRASRAM